MKLLIILLTLCGADMALSAEAMPSDMIDKLRDVATEATEGNISSETAEMTPKIAAWLNAATAQTLMAARSSNQSEGWLRHNATVSMRPSQSCQAVRNGFYQAKTYWRELLCITKQVIALSGKPCPDLKCIEKLTRRAKQLGVWIEIVYPSAWDRKDQTLERTWSLPSGEITDVEIAQLNWGGLAWNRDSAPTTFAMTWTPTSVLITQALSVTNYCLENQVAQLFARVMSKTKDDSDILAQQVELLLPQQ